jgi:hypothetical protein
MRDTGVGQLTAGPGRRLGRAYGQMPAINPGRTILIIVIGGHRPQ